MEIYCKKCDKVLGNYPDEKIPPNVKGYTSCKICGSRIEICRQDNGKSCAFSKPNNEVVKQSNEPGKHDKSTKKKAFAMLLVGVLILLAVTYKYKLDLAHSIPSPPSEKQELAAVAKSPKNYSYDELIDKAKQAKSTGEMTYYFNKALLQKPDDPIATAGLGLAYLRKSGPSNELMGISREQFHEKGIALFDKAYLINPNLGIVHYYRGRGYNEKSKPDLAIDELNKAIQLDPADPSFYVERGLSFLKKGEYGKALMEGDTALRIDSKNVNAYFLKARVYGRMKKTKSLIAEYDKAITLSPKNEMLYFWRAYALRKEGKIDDYISDMTKAIEINPNSYRFYSMRASAYRKKGLNDLADEDIKKEKEMNPNYYLTDGYNLGITLNGKTKFTESIKLINRAIELDPWNASSYLTRGRVYLGHGSYDKALDDFNKAALIDPERPMIYKFRATALGEKGRIDDAMDDLKRECEFQVENNNVIDYCKDYKIALQSISTLKGKVVEAKTMEPVSKALVVLKSRVYAHNGWSGDSSSIFKGYRYAVTDEEGNFSIPPDFPHKPLFPHPSAAETQSYIEEIYHPVYNKASHVSLDDFDNIQIEVKNRSTLTDRDFEELFISEKKINPRKKDLPLLIEALKTWERNIRHKDKLNSIIDEFQRSLALITKKERK